MFLRNSYGIYLIAMGIACVGINNCALAQSQEETSEEKLRKAVEAQSKVNQSNEAEARRFAADYAAKREAMRKQEEAELRQSELAFNQRIAAIRMEVATRRNELDVTLKGNEEKLTLAVANLKAEMLAKETESERDFKLKRAAFSQELKQSLDGGEKYKQVAMAAALTYATGGAAVPAMAATAAGSKQSPSPAVKPTSTHTLQPSQIAVMPDGAKRFADFLDKQPKSTPIDTTRSCKPIVDHSGSQFSQWLDRQVGEKYGACCGAGNRCDHLPMSCFGDNQNGACGRHDVRLAHECQQPWSRLSDECVRRTHRSLAGESGGVTFPWIFNWLGYDPKSDPRFDPRSLFDR